MQVVLYNGRKIVGDFVVVVVVEWFISWCVCCVISDISVCC